MGKFGEFILRKKGNFRQENFETVSVFGDFPHPKKRRLDIFLKM
jgi:hypothetical protein